MNSFFHFLKQKFALVVVSLLVVLYLFSLWGRIPDIDDAWIGELAYYLSEEGQMRSELMRGITQQEVKFVVNNKLFALSGALFIKAFGFSLYTLKSVSLICFGIFLWIFFNYTVKLRHLFTRSEVVLSLLIIFSFTYLFKFSFLFRPEVMMMTMGFGGYIFLEKYLDKRKLLNLLVSGLLFGLTCAIHLNGLILLASAGLLLFWNRKYFPVLFFGLTALLGFLPFFFDMTRQSDFTLWHHQFFDAPALDSLIAGPLWLKPLYNLAREYLRYFYKIEVAVYSVLLLISLMAGFKYLYKSHRNLLLFALFNIFFTAVIAMHKSQQYLLLNFPYILILLTLTFKAVFKRKIREFRLGSYQLVSGLMVVLFLIFGLSSFYHNTLLAIQKFTPAEHRRMALKYAGSNTANLNVVAPMTFIFDEILHFNRIQGEVCYIELQKGDPAIHGSGFLEKAKTFDITLVMVSRNYIQPLGLSGFQQGDTIAGYHMIHKTPELLVFKRVAD